MKEKKMYGSLNWKGINKHLPDINDYTLCITNKFIEGTKWKLHETLIKVWHHEIPKKMLQNLMNSMPNRVTAGIEARGSPTKC